MLWIAWISQCTHNLGSKSKDGSSQISTLSQSWKIGVVTVSAPIYQSQPACLTFHHTNEERLEGLRCCEMTESVCTRSMLVWNVGAMHQNFHHQWLKSRGVMTVVEDEFQSPPSPTIHYTYNDILEWLGCCELPESVHSHSILVYKVEYRPSQLYPQPRPKTPCGDHFTAHHPISIFSSLSSYY